MGRHQEALRLILIAALGAIAATFAIRGIDWLTARFPVVVTRVIAVTEWLAAYGWHLVRETPISQVILLVVLCSAVAFRQRVGSAVWALSTRIVAWAAQRLPHRYRDRWKDEWMADLQQLRERPASSLIFAARVARSSSRLVSLP